MSSPNLQWRGEGWRWVGWNKEKELLTKPLGFETTNLQEFEVARTGRFFIMGTCVVAPCIRTWYLFMEKVVKFQGSYHSMNSFREKPVKNVGLPSL